MPEALRIVGLSHSYGATAVLDGVSLELEQGRVLSLLGPSGCGKTTLLRAVAGLLSPSRGRVLIGGEAVFDGTERVPCERRRVGLVFQDYALFPTLSVADNIGFGLPGPEPGRVAELLEVMGLSALAERRPAQLSGGQQQRVALARALAPRPELLLLDEPFANVDSERRLELGRFLREVLRTEGTSALLVTHDQDAALRLGDHLAVIQPGPRGGRVAQTGAPEQVYRQPGSLEVARLTGACWEQDGAIVRPEDSSFVEGPGEDRVLAAAFVGRGWSLLVRTAWGEVRLDAPERVEVGAAGRVVVSRSWTPG
jgi:iron(III) transport system ATP-binding protein